MSLADNKKGVFDKISSFTSLAKQGNDTLENITFPSINNKGDVTDFIVETIKTVVGVEGIKLAISQMFSGLIGQIEPQLKSVLIKQFTQSSANQQFSVGLTTNGITTSVKSIDSKGKLKVDPNSANGSMIYGSPTTSFDGAAYNAIQNSGNFESYNGQMSIKYIEGSDSFQIKPDVGSVNVNVGEYFTNFINDTEILNEKEIISSVMDGVFGTLANNQDKTPEQILEELKAEQLFQQLIDGDDSFVISPDDNDALITKANELSNGIINYDMGCGLMPASLDFDKFSELITNISGSTDPYYIGDQLEKTIDESSISPETTAENKETIKDGFFQLMIKIFMIKIVEAVTTAPQVLTLIALISAVQGKIGELSEYVTETIKTIKIIIKCMMREVIQLIAAFLFTMAIGYLIALITPVIKKIIKEQIEQFKEMLANLIKSRIPVD